MCQLYILFNSTSGVELFLLEHFYFHQTEGTSSVMVKLEKIKKYPFENEKKCLLFELTTAICIAYTFCQRLDMNFVSG